MRNHWYFVPTSIFFFIGVLGFADDSVRKITLETKKIDGAVRWIPEKIETYPGEKLNITVKHDLDEGFDFHGLFIPALKVTKKIDRHKPETVLVTVPRDLKPGEYKVGCHFHEKHIAATLIVKLAPK